MPTPESVAAAGFEPFPGLRPFDVEDSLLFFGRESHTEALLERLAENRFLAVVGGSGGGKSSLVKAGLLPALFRGYLVGSTTRWRIAVMRPGAAPLSALAEALGQQAEIGTGDECLEELKASTLGLIRAAERARFKPGESLLVVVDQFEELFRSGGVGGDERRHFVSLLLNAVDQSAVPIYIVITMRYEYYADCAQFPGLPEALNSSQYLIPRLTRDQRQAAIQEPLRLVGVDIAPRLVQTILNDAGDDPYQLPVMQHSLLRTYRCWKSSSPNGRIDVEHYARATGDFGALDAHADELHARFDADRQRLVERVFRCLTVTDEDGRVTRRRTRFDQLCRVVGDDAGTVATVVERFAEPANSLLMLSSARLEPETWVDISHESLIVRWRLLQGWVKKEAQSADRYRDLARAALGYPVETGLWRDPDLRQALALRERDGWNAAWAAQYWPADRPPTFDETTEFLDESRRRQDLDTADKKARQEKELNLQRRTARLSAGVATLALLALALVVVWALRELQNAREKRKAIAQQTAAAAAVEDERRKAASQVETIQAKIHDLEGQLQQAAPAARSGLEQQLDLYKSKQSNAEREAVAKGNEAQALRAQLAKLQPETAALTRQIAALEDKLLQATNETASARRDTERQKARADQAEAALKTGKPISSSPPRFEPVESRLKWHEYFRRGKEAMDKGRLDRAAAYLRAAVALNPRSRLDDGSLDQFRYDYFPHYELAELYAKMGEPLAARAELDREEKEGLIQGHKEFRTRADELSARLTSAGAPKR